MGTSKGYGMPTGGEWTPLKNEASRFVKVIAGSGDGSSGGSTPASPGRVLERYLGALGGSRKVSSGRGGAGGSGGIGRSAGKTGGVLGGFLSGVNSHGLTETLRDLGLSDLVGKSADEVANGLLDAFCAPASTLDEEAVRTALSDVYSEMLDAAATYEEVERIFSETVGEKGVTKILVDFFGKYLYRLFCRDFYEGWQKRVGAAQANRKLGDVKDYIFSSLKTKFAGEDTTHKNWSGREGQRLSQKIMQDTLYVFEVAK